MARAPVEGDFDTTSLRGVARNSRRMVLQKCKGCAAAIPTEQSSECREASTNFVLTNCSDAARAAEGSRPIRADDDGHLSRPGGREDWLHECMGTAQVFFGLGCPREFAALFGLVYGGAFDSRSGWNSSDKIARRKCLQVVNEMNPLFVLGSPKCAVFFSTWGDGIAHLSFLDASLQNAVFWTSVVLARTPVDSVDLDIKLRQGGTQHELRFCEEWRPVPFWLRLCQARMEIPWLESCEVV